MSWMQQLYDTYEANAGRTVSAGDAIPLLPVGHALQQARIEVFLDQNGNFLRANAIQPTYTIIPVTEASSIRTNSNAPHGLSDKVQYVAGDYEQFGGRKRSYFSTYVRQLQDWCLQSDHTTPQAVLAYVQKRSLVSDLVRVGVLYIDPQDILITRWPTGTPAPEFFRSLAKTKDGLQDQGDALIRWHVETVGVPLSATWEDLTLRDSWIDFVTARISKMGYCQITGVERIIARKHPARMRHGKDLAKLISSDDESGYTFRGRFLDADQAITIGSDVTQKAHSALRWLIGRRQAFRNGDQVIVSWTVSGKDIPDPLADSSALFGDSDPVLEIEVQNSNDRDGGQAFARRLAKRIAGYESTLGPTDDVMIMGLDSATPGRMAVTYYRELTGSEFLERVNAWHTELAWPQCFSWNHAFIGAPSPKDIAQAAFGSKVDGNLLRSTIERLLPCIIDGQRIPRDLVDSTVRRMARRVGMSSEKRRGTAYESEWEKSLGIACSLFKGFYRERNYRMALERNRTSRDYLYGRLFALAEHLEKRALYVAGENRDTTAARNIQRFCDRPYSTWLNIEGKGLPPYRSRLRSKWPGFLHQINSLFDEVHALFEHDDYISDAPLTGEWLLGYHCQRSELKNSAVGEDNSSKDSPKERN